MPSLILRGAGYLASGLACCQSAMIIAMISMWVMELSLIEIIHVISMWNGLMSTFAMSTCTTRRSTTIRILATHENVTKRFYRPEIRKCLECQKPIKRAVTLSQRTVVTFQEVIKVVHGGYRCKNPKCSAQSRT